MKKTWTNEKFAIKTKYIYKWPTTKYKSDAWNTYNETKYFIYVQINVLESNGNGIVLNRIHRSTFLSAVLIKLSEYVVVVAVVVYFMDSFSFVCSRIRIIRNISLSLFFLSLSFTLEIVQIFSFFSLAKLLFFISSTLSIYFSVYGHRYYR